MKIMRYLFCIILILSNIEVQGTTYSIDALLDYLQETEYYEIIEAIKNAFGDDIAIDVCKQLTKSNDCEQVVRIYMVFYEPEPEAEETDEDGSGSGVGMHHAPSINTANATEIINYIKKYCIIKKEKDKKLIKFILRYYFILIQQMKEDKEIIKFFQGVTGILCINPDLIIKEKKKDKKMESIPTNSNSL